jgi:Pentapeptide repeats (9 copies)
MDRYLKIALRSAATKLADFVANNFIFLFLLGCLIGLLTTAAYWDWSFWGEATYENGRLASLKVDRGRIIQQSLIVFGGFIALFLAMWRTWTAKIQADAALQQVELAGRGQNIERFVKAVEMLSSESATQRRAALFALNELARLDIPTSYVTVLHTLKAFVEEASNQYRSGTGQGTQEIADAFVMIGRLKAIYDPKGEHLADNNTRTPFLQINNLILREANCVFTDYSQFYFRNATFEKSGLIHSIFSRAVFENCTFSDTLTNYSDFSTCNFDSCVFRGRHFRQAILAQSRFKDAKFEPDARISVCYISGADFAECPDLVQENIDDCTASTDNPPKFPPGKKINFRSMRSEEVRQRWPDEVRWFAWAGALRNLPHDEAVRRAGAMGIDPEFIRLSIGGF